MKGSRKGDYCEFLVLAHAAKHGWEVALPFGNQRGWDILAKVDGHWQEWQVKAVKVTDETVNITFGRQYRKSEFDYLIAVDPVDIRFWRLPVVEVAGRRRKAFSSSKFIWEI